MPVDETTIVADPTATVDPTVIDPLTDPSINNTPTDNVILNLDINSIPLELVPVIRKYTESELNVIVELTQADGFTYSEDEGLILINPKQVIPSDDILLVKREEKELTLRKERLHSELISMCTYLTQTIKQWLSSKYVTPDQQERYEIKAKAAIQNKVDYFIDEATLLGLTPEELMAAVLAMSVQWEQAMDMAAIKIDAIRVYIKQQIDLDIDFANYAIDNIRNNLSTFSLETPIKETVDSLKASYASRVQ